MIIQQHSSYMTSSWRLVFAMLTLMSSISAETKDLPFGDINVVILTDVHSWLGSHRRQQPQYNADLGDILSFWERLKEDSDENGRDIFLVNNGDFVDGTGLSRAMDGDNYPEYLIPLLEKMPYDAVNVGNHELYSKKNIEYMLRPGGYVEWWGDRYLTSNINRVDTTNVQGKTTIPEESNVPLGNRYKILNGKSSKLLTFGFLYNMRGYATGAGIEIEKVQTTVTQQWFVDALIKEDYDAILVLAHMDLVDPLVDVIRSAIRDNIGDDTPVVFVTGHTHYRGVKQLENNTMTFEAGRYLDTVGFVSFPSKKIAKDENSPSLFQHRFLDTNNKLLFEDILGFSTVEDGKTKNGKDFSEFISRTRADLGLDKVIGCAPKSYHVNRHLSAPDSLWGLYRDQVIPKVFSAKKAIPKIKGNEALEEEEQVLFAMLLSSGDWRYDLYNTSSLVVDDMYAIAPFNDTLMHVGSFSADVILEANKTLNKHHGMLPKFVLIGDLVHQSSSATRGGSSRNAATQYHLFTHEFSEGEVQKTFQRLAPSTKIEPQKTDYTSALIWETFVEKYWSCDGTSHSLPDLLPHYDNIDSDLQSQNGEIVSSKSNSYVKAPPESRTGKVYWEFTELDDFPYYPEEFEDHGGISPIERVVQKMEDNGIQFGQYMLDNFVVGGVNLAQYEAVHPPFLLYEDFDIGSYLEGGANHIDWTWKDLLRIRNSLERPSLSWYVDKVARKRWFAEHQYYPQPDVYYLQYKDELSETGNKEDVKKTILANLPTQHGFCAKPTHMSMTLGNWLVDIEPGSDINTEARFTKQAKRLTSSDPEGNSYDPNKCADSLAEGIQREAMPIESWALKNVRPGIVIEELFSNHEDRSLPPHEFCMFVVWGKFYVGQWNSVGDDRYLDGFFYRDGRAAPGCSRNELPDWVPWQYLVEVAESLSRHKDMFRVDIFVGVPRYSSDDAELQIAISESEIHPTTMFCNPFIAEEMARLWVAGYKIGNYETIPNDEVPLEFTNKQT